MKVITSFSVSQGNFTEERKLIESKSFFDLHAAQIEISSNRETALAPCPSATIEQVFPCLFPGVCVERACADGNSCIHNR